MRFRNRLTLFLVSLLAAMQVATIVVAYVYARHATIEDGKKELAFSNQSFRQYLDILADRVATGVHVLSLDFALRSALAQSDEATTYSTLTNHGRRINARRMMYVDPDGVVQVDTGVEEQVAVPFQFQSLISEAYQNQNATALTTIDGEIFWTVVEPVNAPDLVGFVAAFVPVDRAVLEDIRRLASTPVTISLASHDADGWHILQSSNGWEDDFKLPVNFNPMRDQTTTIRQNGTAYILSVHELTTAKASLPIYVLHKDRLDDVLASNSALFIPMLLVLIVAVLLAGLGAFFIARSVAAPIESLAAVARRIRGGDYSVPESVDGGHEINQLSAALSEMVVGVREREGALHENARLLEEARDEARMADKAKSNFIANMSHELRTPLNSIIGFADVIGQQQLGPLGSDDYLEYAQYIANGGRGLLSIFNAMLDVARLEAGKFDVRMESVGVKQLASEAKHRFEDAAAAKAINLSVNVPTDSPMIRGDFRALSKAVDCLIDNAIKFTGEGGTISMDVKEEGRRALLTIIDDGVGMAPDEIKRMLRPFERGHTEYGAEFSGVGLGLSIAASIVKLHEGSFTVTSALGQGTTISISLPQVQEASKVQSVAA